MGEAKCRIGDWDLDLIIGGMPRGAWISLVDRASKHMVLIGVAGKTAAAVTEAIVQRMAPIRDRVHTGTADHGQEFAGHREIAAVLGADWDFATPDPSWERGLNEHTNGLVRQDFPKGTDFRQVTPAPEGAGVSDPEGGLHRCRPTRKAVIPPSPIPSFQKPVFDGPGPARPKPA